MRFETLIFTTSLSNVCGLRLQNQSNLNFKCFERQKYQKKKKHRKVWARRKFMSNKCENSCSPTFIDNYGRRNVAMVFSKKEKMLILIIDFGQLYDRNTWYLKDMSSYLNSLVCEFQSLHFKWGSEEKNRKINVKMTESCIFIY